MNKAHTLLAQKLKKSECSHTTTPHQIKNRLGCLLSHPQDIVHSFEEFYTALYNNPEIPPLHLLPLNAPITEEELMLTIKILPTHKSPGPDGLPYEYYKSFFPLLIPHMCKLFNAFLQQTPIPSDMQRSFLTLIPKPEKDPSLCASYRSIALLNSDLKIFSKLLSIRLTLFYPL